MVGGRGVRHPDRMLVGGRSGGARGYLTVAAKTALATGFPCVGYADLMIALLLASSYPDLFAATTPDHRHLPPPRRPGRIRFDEILNGPSPPSPACSPSARSNTGCFLMMQFVPGEPPVRGLSAGMVFGSSRASLLPRAVFRSVKPNLSRPRAIWLIRLTICSSPFWSFSSSHGHHD
jgi:hypothetical protein